MAELPNLSSFEDEAQYFEKYRVIQRQGAQGQYAESVWQASGTVPCSGEWFSGSLHDCSYSVISTDTAWTVTNHSPDGAELYVYRCGYISSYYKHEVDLYAYWDHQKGKIVDWFDWNGIPAGGSATFSVADIADAMNKNYHVGHPEDPDGSSLNDESIIELSFAFFEPDDSSGYSEHRGNHIFKIDNAAAAAILAQNPAPSTPETPVVTTPSTNFTDVAAGAYAKAAIWAYEKGMVSGTTFDVDKPCTRAMAVTYLWQAAGSPGKAENIMRFFQNERNGMSTRKQPVCGMMYKQKTEIFSPRICNKTVCSPVCKLNGPASRCHSVEQSCFLTCKMEICDSIEACYSIHS